jgi:hypothetical protein
MKPNPLSSLNHFTVPVTLSPDISTSQQTGSDDITRIRGSSCSKCEKFSLANHYQVGSGDKKKGGHPARPVYQVSRLVGVMTLALPRPETPFSMVVD